MSRTDDTQEGMAGSDQPARRARRETKPLDEKNALLALNRREPEAQRRAPEADSLETLDTERFLELPRRAEPTPITPLPVPRQPRGMTLLGEVTASYLARLPRRSAPEP